jgi:hypothetical protein
MRRDLSAEPNPFSPDFSNEFNEYFAAQDQIEFTALLGTSPDQLSDDAKSMIASAAFRIHFMLQQPRPEGDQRKVSSRKALKVLENHTQALLRVMSELDPDTQELLQEEALWKFGPYLNYIDGQENSNREFHPDRIKRRRYSVWLAHLKQIELTAGTLLERFGRRGPPAKEERLTAIRMLIQVWKDHIKVDPTLSYNRRTRQTTGPFLQFCEIVLRRVFEENKQSINLERAVRDELYGRVRAKK